jgi:uncharacterized protein (DUF58 family)
LGRLEWTVLRRLDGLRQGDRLSRRRGQGLDFADLREYQPHDDVRHIDWNVTARLGQPHVREFLEERDMAVWFLLDLSASMDWGSAQDPGAATDGAQGAPRSKQAAATELVALLARLFSRGGHRVGALLYRQDVEQVLPPRSGRAQVLTLLTHLQKPAPAGPRRRQLPTPALEGVGAEAADRPATFVARLMQRLRGRRPQALPAESTRLADLLGAAERQIRARSSVVLVSDFLSQPGWEAPLGRLALRHDVVVVHLTDPLERQLPDAGWLVLQDAESGESLQVDCGDPALRERYAHLARQRQEALEEHWRRCGVDSFELGSGAPMLATLQRFLHLRGLLSRQTRPARGLLAPSPRGAA